jgi:hypothetical protein
MTIEPPLAADEEPGEVDATWAETIASRLDDIESGRVQPVSGRETMARIRAKIAAWES